MVHGCKRGGHIPLTLETRPRERKTKTIKVGSHPRCRKNPRGLTRGQKGELSVVRTHRGMLSNIRSSNAWSSSNSSDDPNIRSNLRRLSLWTWRGKIGCQMNFEGQPVYQHLIPSRIAKVIERVHVEWTSVPGSKGPAISLRARVLRHKIMNATC